MSNAAEIVRLEEHLRTKRYNFDNTVQEIVDHIDSHHRDVTTERAPGEKKNQKQFDGTALYASQVFADFYQGSVFNQSTKWFSINHSDPAINGRPNNAAWLRMLRDKALQHMRYFYGPGGQAISSWGLFGNGPVLIEDVPQKRKGLARIRYTSIPWGQYVMAEGDDGVIDKFIRRLKLPAYQIIQQFGKENVSDDLRKAGTSSSAAEQMKEFEILHSIMPRDMQAYSKSKIKTNKEYDFASCWVELGKKKLIKESGYRKFPVAIARYHPVSGEVYARGLGEIALADAKSLNEADKCALLKWQRELEPPILQRRNSVIGGKLDFRPSARNVVTDINNSVKAFNEGSNWPAHDTMMGRKQEQILRVFHVNEILNLLAREKPEMTAFEVNARLTLLQQILGPVFGRNDVDFFNVVIALTVDSMAYNRLIEDPPDDIAQSFGEGAFEFVYEGPLARAQRNQELVAIQQFVADIGGIMQFHPEVIQRVDWEKIEDRVAEIRGVQDLMLPDDQATANINKERQKQNAMTALQVAGGAAESLGKAAPGIKELREGALPQAA